LSTALLAAIRYPDGGGDVNERILIVEDEPRIGDVLERYLRAAGFLTERASSGRRALELWRAANPDAILLDLMIPDMDGLEVARKVRATSDVPILMVTAKDDELDRLVGLELGADDYIAKPFSPRELLARLRAVLRRAEPAVAAERLSVAGIDLDVASRSVRVDGRDVELTGIEFDILHALLRRAGRVVPRAALLSEAGRDDVTVSDRTVDVHISHLRKKLGEPQRIRTVRGVGYVFAREPADA
jgi:DNA-binding response OmpR family regulator